MSAAMTSRPALTNHRPRQQQQQQPSDTRGFSASDLRKSTLQTYLAARAGASCFLSVAFFVVNIKKLLVVMRITDRLTRTPVAGR